MPIPDLTAKCRLHGLSVFLSASIPTPERREEYERIPEAPLRIEEAVACIARAIFMEGGTLVFGAHPSISPLVARVVDDYYIPAAAEEVRQETHPKQRQAQWKNPSIVIYQSRVWEPLWAEETQRLTRHPLVRVVWTDAAYDETIDPNIKHGPQAPTSMEAMRKAMINQTSPVAMVAIGGMKGVLDETRIFSAERPGRPIFVLATTGGAAKILARESQYENTVRGIDEEGEHLVRRFWAHQENRDIQSKIRQRENRNFYIPYAFVAQQIVAHIIKENEI